MSNRKIAPTMEVYGPLQAAFDFYNSKLFANKLPPCMITLNRRGDGYGYFHANQFKSSDGAACEISMNANHLTNRPIKEVLGTLAHEMCHLAEEVDGTAPRQCYHNKRFSQLMERIGLITSDTGKPGGRRTGQSMSHYIQDGGLFEKVTDELLAGGFELRWSAVELGAERSSAGSKKNKQKYQCGCGCNIWAAPGLTMIHHDDCDTDFKECK